MSGVDDRGASCRLACAAAEFVRLSVNPIEALRQK
jgi:hypothetical protein